MKRVLWISRHQMTPFQVQDLVRGIDDDVEISTYDKTVQDVNELEEAIEASDLVAAVLPMEKMMELFHVVGDRPLIQAVSGRVETDQWIELEDGRKERKYLFEHLYWQQIMKCEIVTKKL